MGQSFIIGDSLLVSVIVESSFLYVFLRSFVRFMRRWVVYSCMALRVSLTPDLVRCFGHFVRAASVSLMALVSQHDFCSVRVVSIVFVVVNRHLFRRAPAFLSSFIVRAGLSPFLFLFVLFSHFPCLFLLPFSCFVLREYFSGWSIVFRSGFSLRASSCVL